MFGSWDSKFQSYRIRTGPNWNRLWFCTVSSIDRCTYYWTGYNPTIGRSTIQYVPSCNVSKERPVGRSMTYVVFFVSLPLLRIKRGRYETRRFWARKELSPGKAIMRATNLIIIVNAHGRGLEEQWGGCNIEIRYFHKWSRHIEPKAQCFVIDDPELAVSCFRPPSTLARFYERSQLFWLKTDSLGRTYPDYELNFSLFPSPNSCSPRCSVHSHSNNIIFFFWFLSFYFFRFLTW